MRKVFIAILGSFCQVFGLGIEQAESYSQHSDCQLFWAMNAIEHYPWRGTERVLDIGCGDGKITASISNQLHGGLAIGLDISAKAIDFASSTFSNPHLLFMQGDACQLPFKGQFDLIVSFSALHWILDQERALLEMHKSLATGGKILLVRPATCLNNFSPLWKELLHQEKWAPHFPEFKGQRVYFNGEEYLAILKKTGFKPIYIQTLFYETVYPDEKAFIEWVIPVMDFIDHLSLELQEEFARDFMKLLFRLEPKKEDGSIHLEHATLEILAVKND